MLVAALGQNATNVALAIPPWILLANTEGEEAQLPQEGRDTTASEAQTDTSVHRRRARGRLRNVTRMVRGDREPTLESCQMEHMRDSVFNRLERPVADPNLDDDYDSECERSTGSRGNAYPRTRLDARQARLEQQVENWPPI